MKAAPIKIEKGIPIPGGQVGAQTAIIRKMVADDSVFFKLEEDANRFAMAMRFHNKPTKFGCAMRPVKGGWRVWRTASKRPGGGGKK